MCIPTVAYENTAMLIKDQVKITRDWQYVMVNVLSSFKLGCFKDSGKNG